MKLRESWQYNIDITVIVIITIIIKCYYTFYIYIF